MVDPADKGVWHVVDASQSLDEVTRAVGEVALGVTKRLGTTEEVPPLATLWPLEEQSI